jgi:hypothetical protein
MYKFLDTSELPKMYQENIKNMNKSITSNKTEAVIVSQKRKAQDQVSNDWIKDVI